MADEDTHDRIAARRDMVISLRTREDAIIVDPDRFIAAARRAYLADNPQASTQQVQQAIADVRDAAYALIDRYGSLTSGHPDVAAERISRLVMHGGTGARPGDLITDRLDGLSPAGSIRSLALDVATLQSYGCFLPDRDDLFGGMP